MYGYRFENGNIVRVKLNFGGEKEHPVQVTCDEPTCAHEFTAMLGTLVKCPKCGRDTHA